MLETIISLWENKYFNISIVFNLFIRIVLFILRKLSVKIGAKTVFIKLMKWKYSKSVQ